MKLEIEKGENNKILRAKSKPVGEITDELLEFIKNMKETLAASENGIGLAAPQVGRNIQIFVIDEEIADGGETVFINPIITKMSKNKAELEEGCLSLPEIWHDLGRADKVTVKAKNEKGENFKLRAKNILARLIAHEVDHLNGILFIDRIEK